MMIGTGDSRVPEVLMSNQTIRRRCMKCDKWATHHAAYAESPGTEARQEWYCDEHATEAGLAADPRSVQPESHLKARLQAEGVALEAARFIFNALGTIIPPHGEKPRHVNAQQLCEAIRNTAIERYGNNARATLAAWGLASWPDVGRAVFAMIAAGMLAARESDSLDDFDRITGLDDLFG